MKFGSDNLVNDPINELFKGTPTDFINSIERKRPGICTGNVACDIHYNLDWSSRVHVSVPCSDPKTDDVCYGANACICDNGFFIVTAVMPATPVSYVGH